MKNLIKLACASLTLATIFVSCNDDDQSNPSNIPTSYEFDEIQRTALANRVQNFDFNVADGNITLTSAHGVTIEFNAACLSRNGFPVTGAARLQFVEIFKGGDMVVTNKPTMGRMDNGNRALLLSGGQFYIQAYQNGAKLDFSCEISLTVPASLTNGVNSDMVLWEENATTKADTLDVPTVDWVRNEGASSANSSGVSAENGAYHTYFNHFGWINVDCLYNDPRPKTTLSARVPNGFNDGNCRILLSLDGKSNALAKLNTYDATTGTFGEQSEQIPLGLACHVIFVTRENGQYYRYAIKAVTVSANMTVPFDLADTTTGSEAQLVQAISDIQD